jgi:hypothetical protein
LLLDGDTGVSEHQRDAIRREVRPECGPGFWFFEPEQRRRGFNHRHLGAEPREGLPELEADGARAEDRQRGGELPRNRRLAVGPEVDLVQPRNRWDERGAASGDHDAAARHELLVSYPDRALIGELAFASKEAGPRRLDRCGSSTVVEVARHP